ncbi:MAG: transposase [Synechococcus sp. SB0662_bin_45]|uniref:Transposase n=1 Tax=Synechococcus sp. SB0676_bin_10 TaxID=2604869 RepID=A0A6B1F7K3_9SYNE|nr:transposase [Cyanobacteria bacterium MAG IRC3_bin_20]MDE0648075.1 transposase [Cyanobacteria bacterium MAG IRC4_bin_6]MXW11351.1 transposase [Synechococcus sp. SB0668_bin_13]MYE21437.1 transposase [Synechococcus sp. SB0662_bin_45]MYG38759.1 transposase [Synechococcus sp. SB0676_bin_10]MYG63901.1 transposase [Synechococcus sp. SB0675_bin_7]
MSRQRFVITDRLWQRSAPLLPGKAMDRGVTARGNRLFLEAVLTEGGHCATWRDLPACFRNWNSQLGRFRRWATSGVLQRVFEVLSKATGT